MVRIYGTDKTKTRDGARVSKTYHPPATPCDRLLACARVDDAVKQRLREQFAGLDPVRLLRDIRSAQQAISELAARGSREASSNPATDLAAFLSGLRSAWKDGEVRPTHGKPSSTPRWWRTRQDPFADAWPLVEGWLIAEPTATAKELLARLVAMLPEVYAGKAQLRTLQRRIQAWRAERAKDLIVGKLRRAAATEPQA